MMRALVTSVYIAAISAGGATANAQGGTTDSQTLLTLATLNVGGDGPQAEYLGGKWQGEYGPVEVAVGAKLLFLANYNASAKTKCSLGKLKARYDGRYGTAFKALCNKTGEPTPTGRGLRDAGVVDYIFGGQEPKSWGDVINKDKCTLPLLARYLMHGDQGCFQRDFMTESIAVFNKIDEEKVNKENEKIKDESKKKKPKEITKFPGLSSLDQSEVCKNRTVFPFFGGGFMELAKIGFMKSAETAPDMGAMQAAYVESVEACPNKRANNAHIPLMAFDFFVLKEFDNLHSEYDKVEDLTPAGVKQGKKDLVKSIQDKSDVFFVQESKDVLTTDGKTTTGQQMLADPYTAQATLVKDELDTSILIKNENGFIERQSLYENWTALASKVQKEARPLRYMVSNFESGKDDHDVQATTIALAKIEGLNVMLISAHPKSNGRPCVWFAYMARRFFKELRKKPEQEKPDLLLVGMDANVLTTEDQTANAKDPLKNGWTWSSFKEKCEYMGYHVVHDPKRDTVHKQRTFLQTQLGKAAKKDKTKKDILLAYSESCEITIDEVTVLNTIDSEKDEVGKRFGLEKFGYDDETAYPTSTWPLDHFLTIAKLTVTPGKEQKWTGQLQDWEDKKYEERICMTLQTTSTTTKTGEVKSKKPKLAGDIEAMMDMEKPKGNSVGPEFNWCGFMGQFDFADDNEYAVVPQNMVLMQPDIKREDWGAYDSSIFESGRVTTYQGDKNAEDWKKWEMRETDRPPPFPATGLPSDHLPVLLTLTYKGKGGGEIKVGTFNVLSVTKSSLSAASFPGFPVAALNNHNGRKPEMLDITASSTWIAEQLEEIKTAFDFDIMALQEIDYPLYNALVNMTETSSTLGFDILQQCGDAKPVEGKRASQMELLRTGWPRGKANEGPRKDIPAIVWDKQKLTLVGCTAVGTISSIGFCHFEWEKDTAKAGTKFNLLAMHGDGDKGFRAEEAAIVKQQLGDAVIHAVVGDLNLHAREDVLASVTTLSGAMKVPDHKGASVYRYVHPFRKVVQNMQNSKSYACAPKEELKCPTDLNKNGDEDFTIDKDKKAITKYKEKNLDKKQSENFYKLCESHIWAGTNNKGVEDFNVLTWNAGGGQPTPEFLGGQWEYAHEGLFSEIEKLTGVLLFEIAGCNVSEFGEGTDFEKYKARYSKMYNWWQERKYSAKFTPFTNANLIPAQLLDGLPEALKTRSGRQQVPKFPDWKSKCTIPYMIGGGLGLCKAEYEGEKDLSKTCSFDLGSEGCFPLRHGLPVYGANFAELLRLDTERRLQWPEYWAFYFKGLLENQTEWPAKGCKKVPGQAKGLPHDFMQIQLGKKSKKEIVDKKVIMVPLTQADRDKEVPASFKYEKWTQVAAWDTLVIRIARFAAEVLGKELKEPGKTGEGSMKHIMVMPKDDVTDRIKTLVGKAAIDMEAKVIFLQERDKISEIEGFAVKGKTTDTAVFVKTDFAEIDTDGTKAAEAAVETAWTTMMAAVQKEVDEQSTEVDEQSIFSVAGPLLEPLRDEQLAKMTIECKMVKKAGTEEEEKKCDLKWAKNERKLETIVVTTNGLLLLSIHADGDGYFCAQYLHMAAKMYDKLASVLGLKSMIIGMDTNVQPPPGHLAFAEAKGYDLKQLTSVLPRNMRLIEPKHRTVLKVRSFLQTQFGKIGKNDDIKKDMLFQYGGLVEGRGDTEARVMNDCVRKDEYLIYDDTDTRYYPKNDWPVDHFMVSQKMYVKMGEQPKETNLKKYIFDKVTTKLAQKAFAKEVVAELVKAKETFKVRMEEAKKKKKEAKLKKYIFDKVNDKVKPAVNNQENKEEETKPEEKNPLISNQEKATNKISFSDTKERQTKTVDKKRKFKFGTRAREVFHKLRAKLRTLNPLRRPKVAKPATASVTKHHSIAKKIKKSMSKFSKKFKRMIFGREA